MKLLRILLLFLFMTSFSQTTEAQIWKKIKDKVKRKAEEKVDQKTDKMIDDALNGNKNNKESTNLLTTYKFSQSILIEFSTNDGSKAELELLFSVDNKNIVCMTLDPKNPNEMGGEVYNVITPKNVTMFMNMPGVKIKKTMPNEQFAKFDNSKKIPAKNEFKKTGDIKTILGFACHEYTYKNDGGTVTAWVTKENFPIKGKFIPMLGMNNNESFEGFVMELNFKATNESGVVKVVKINKNRAVIINTKEYKSMGF